MDREARESTGRESRREMVVTWINTVAMEGNRNTGFVTIDALFLY